MPALRAPKLSTDRIKPDEFKALNQFLDDVARALQGELSLGENLALTPVPATFQNAGDVLAVEHGLGRAPVGFFVVRNDIGAVVYDADQPPTATRIYLKATISNAKVQLVFF